MKPASQIRAPTSTPEAVARPILSYKERRALQFDIVNKGLEVWNGIRNPEEMALYYEPDIVGSFPLVGELRGIEGILKGLQTWHSVLRPFHITGVPLAGTNPNEIILKWTVRGVFSGPFGDIKPTGKKISSHGFTIIEFNDRNRIVREEVIFDGHLQLKKMQGQVDEPQF